MEIIAAKIISVAILSRYPLIFHNMTILIIKHLT